MDHNLYCYMGVYFVYAYGSKDPLHTHNQYPWYIRGFYTCVSSAVLMGVLSLDKPSCYQDKLGSKSLEQQDIGLRPIQHKVLCLVSYISWMYMKHTITFYFTALLISTTINRNYTVNFPIKNLKLSFYGYLWYILLEEHYFEVYG